MPIFKIMLFTQNSHPKASMKWIKVDENKPKWTKWTVVDRIDRYRLKWIEWIEFNLMYNEKVSPKAKFK